MAEPRSERRFRGRHPEYVYVPTYLLTNVLRSKTGAFPAVIAGMQANDELLPLLRARPSFGGDDFF
jgi:hypothetical protein